MTLGSLILAIFKTRIRRMRTRIRGMRRTWRTRRIQRTRQSKWEQMEQF